MKVIDVLKKTIADLTVQNAALSIDLEEAQTKLDIAQMKEAQTKDAEKKP